MKLRNKHDSDPEWDKEHKKWEKKSTIIERLNMRENWKKWVELQVSLGYPNIDKLCLEKQDLIMDEGLESNYPTQEEIIAYNRKEYKEKEREKRMFFLQQQIAAGGRLDGWSLQGAKDELKRLEEENEGTKETL
tara:strand:+ start:14389 stop:14790 length:402 start_codon:yes stop_codon:yes gene_type:complete